MAQIEARLDGTSVHSVQRTRKTAVRFSALLALVLIGISRPLAGFDQLSAAIEIGGIGLITVCVIGRSWCALYIGGRKMRELVDCGPFSVVRNPLYVFSIIGGAGLGAQTGSIVIALIFAATTYAIFAWVVLKEEACLRRRFGAPYLLYTARVPRFLPRFQLWRDAPSLEVAPRLFVLTLRDGLVFPALIPLFHMADWAQQKGYFPVLLNLP